MQKLTFRNFETMFAFVEQAAKSGLAYQLNETAIGDFEVIITGF